MDRPAPGHGPLLRDRDFLTAAALFLVFLPLYFFTRDHAYAFDSLLTALSIRRPLFGGPPAALLSWNHFLWLPVCRWFYLAQRAAGLGLDVYGSLQLLNALGGGLLLALLYGFLSRHIHHGWALAAACLAGFSHTVWLRSTSGDPYLAGTLLGAAACALLTPLPERPGLPRLFGIAALLVLSGYMHVANLVLVPAAALAASWRRGRRGLAAAAALCAFAGALLLPYIVFYELYTPRGLAEWLAWGSGRVNGQAPGASASGQFSLDFLRNIPVLFVTLLRSFAEVPGWDRLPAWALALPAAAFGAWTLADRQRRVLFLGPAFAPAVFFAAIAGLFAVWIPGNIFYWAGPLAFLLMTLGPLLAPRLAARPALSAAIAAAALSAVVAAANFRTVIAPNMAGEANGPQIAFCRQVEAATPPGSVLVISGAVQGYLKVALPYFANRQTFALDLLFIQYHGTGGDPLEALRARLAACLAAGLPVYISEDVLGADDKFLPWGVSGGQITTFLAGYRLTPALRLPAGPVGTLYRLEERAP